MLEKHFVSCWMTTQYFEALGTGGEVPPRWDSFSQEIPLKQIVSSLLRHKEVNKPFLSISSKYCSLIIQHSIATTRAHTLVMAEGKRKGGALLTADDFLLVINAFFPHNHILQDKVLDLCKTLQREKKTFLVLHTSAKHWEDVQKVRYNQEFPTHTHKGVFFLFGWLVFK